MFSPTAGLPTRTAAPTGQPASEWRGQSPPPATLQHATADMPVSTAATAGTGCPTPSCHTKTRPPTPTRRAVAATKIRRQVPVEPTPVPSVHAVSTLVVCLHLLTGTAETAFAGQIGLQCRQHRLLVKIRPETVGKIEFGVGQLPDQKVADALLATGTNTQIGGRKIRQRQILRKQRLIDLFRFEPALGTTPSQLLRSRNDIPASAVIGCNIKRQTGIAGRFGLRLVDKLLQLGTEAGQITYDLQTNIVPRQFAHFVFECQHEQLHQPADLNCRTFPVLAAEGEQRQCLDPLLYAALDHGTDAFHPRLVTGQTRQAPFFGPAIVAIHDDGDMTGH